MARLLDLVQLTTITVLTHKLISWDASYHLRSLLEPFSKIGWRFERLLYLLV